MIKPPLDVHTVRRDTLKQTMLAPSSRPLQPQTIEEYLCAQETTAEKGNQNDLYLKLYTQP